MKVVAQSAALAALLLIAGCGDRLPLAPVSGVVTLDGEPLPNASITTQPIATEDNKSPGSGSFGRTDEQGRYELELVEPPTAGAVIGAHRVVIVRNSEVEEDPWNDEVVVRKDRSWPERYTDGSLRFEVPAGGTDQANFELTLDD